MGFLNVLSQIGRGIETGAKIAAPIVPLIPGVGPIFSTVVNSIAAVEHIVPQEGKGPVKKPLVLSLVQAAYPNIDVSKADPAIDHIVAALNILATLEKQ